MVMTKTKRKSKVKPQQIIIRSIKDYNEKIKDIGILKDSISIYTRVSTKGQIDNFSIKDQIQKGLKYISSNHKDIKYIIIWREEGKSGDDFEVNEDMTETLSRELLRHIIGLIDEGFITKLWMNDMSRLSRNDSVSHYLKLKFHSNSVLLIIDNNIYDFDNLNDKLMYGIFSVFNEYENNLRYSKTVSGKISKLKINGWIGGKPNYGFEIVNGRLVPHEKESVVVQQIFKWYGIEEKSIQYIQNELLNLGIKSPRGNTIWNTTSLRNIVHNEVYIGKQVFEIRQLKGKSKKYCDEKGKLFKYTVKLDDKIVDEFTWECTKLRHKRYERTQRQQSNQTKHKYLLSGLLYCSGCDDMLYGINQPSQNRFVYFCNNKGKQWNKRTNKDCKNSKSVNLKILERLVWCSTVDVWSNSYTIKEQFKKDFLLPKIKDKEDVNQGLSNKLSSQSYLLGELSKLEKRKSKLYSDYMMLRVKEKDYKEIEKGIEIEIELRKKKIKVIEKEITMLKKQDVWFNWLDDFEEQLKTIKEWNSKDDFDKMKEFLNNIIEKIDVIWDKESNTHQLVIRYKWNIYKDKRGKKGKWKFNIKKGKSERLSDRFSSYRLSRSLKNGELMLPYSYSTVTDLAKFLG